MMWEASRTVVPSARTASRKVVRKSSPRQRVEARNRLVEQEDGCASSERDRQRDLRLLPARELCGRALRGIT